MSLKRYLQEIPTSDLQNTEDSYLPTQATSSPQYISAGEMDKRNIPLIINTTNTEIPSFFQQCHRTRTDEEPKHLHSGRISIQYLNPNKPQKQRNNIHTTFPNFSINRFISFYIETHIFWLVFYPYKNFIIYLQKYSPSLRQRYIITKSNKKASYYLTNTNSVIYEI